MRWTPGERSADIEDRRGESTGGGFAGGGLGGGMRLGLGGTVVVLLLSVVFGKNFFAVLGGQPGAGAIHPQAPATAGHRPQRHAPATRGSAAEEQLVDFVSFVLDDVQKTWTATLPQAANRRYERAKLVLFTDRVRSGCGYAEAAMGPFYCPADRKVYIDLGFYHELKSRFGAPGDFAQAYVLAHEVGHHVQNLLGTEARLRRLQQAHPAQANQLSVRMELQADCLAGVWAHSTAQRDLLEKGDIEEGMGAAAAVGDDRLQKQATGHVNPERFTHGTSAQRVAWFKRGFQSGSVATCDTFRSAAE